MSRFIMSEFIPRHDLVCVERLDEEKTGTTIVLPDKTHGFLVKLRVVAVGPEVKDLKPDDVVFAENMVQMVDKFNLKIGIILQQYIHLVWTKKIK